MLKAVLCNVTKEPFCLVDVDEKTQTIKFAGAYTKDFQAVNVSVNKLTVSKRVMKAAETVDLYDAVYHAASDTYQLVKNDF